MPRSLALAVVLALAVLLAAAALDDREVAFSTGLPAQVVAAQLSTGSTACTGPVEVLDRFQRLRVVVGTEGRPGPSLRAVVSEQVGGRRLGAGEVAGGYPDGTSVEFDVGDIPAGRRVRVCVTHTGGEPIRLFGSRPDRSQDLQAVPAVVFVRERPESMLALVPEAFERSARFKPGWYGAWTTWLLFAVAAVGVPAALARALYASKRSYSRSEADDS